MTVHALARHEIAGQHAISIARSCGRLALKRIRRTAGRVAAEYEGGRWAEVKMFVYLTDVESEADGPFTFLPGQVSDRFGFSLRSHRGDSEVVGKLSPNEPRAVIAPRLTAFMVETSRCLHMGSR